jgi:hypothetical protein
MPLPAPGTQWPPPAHAAAYEALAVASAWYSSDRDALARVYSRNRGDDPRDRVAQHRGGVVGRAARWFWGQPLNPLQRPARLHVPLGADICSVSANMLFTERPTFTVDGGRMRLPGAGREPREQRLDKVFGEHAMVQLHEAAEVQAGLCGVYLAAGFDEALADHALISQVVHPDSAIPEWRAGRLAAVTFWRVVGRDGDRVWRHLEYHARGYIEHALYEGDARTVGRRVPLTDRPETAELVIPEMIEGGYILTGLDRLDVVYVPNATDRRHRSDPIAHHLGRSDLQGVEPVLDSLDEAWTSWMRDVRHAKSRIHVPTGYLDALGPGQGAMVDLDREVYTELNALNPGGAGLPITATQLAIRFAEHQATTEALAREAVSDAGYSPATFGMGDAVSMTATEVEARERKTLWLRSQKIRRWRLALADLAELLTEIDDREFGSGIGRVRPDVEFAPYASPGPLERAQTVALLAGAEAASRETLVAIQHPDWDAKRRADEVAAIEKQRAADAPADPMSFPP